jgi:mRNA interferase MazF
MTSYRRGDVVLILFPDSNLRTSKRRPALVVQADQLGTDLAQTNRGHDQQQHGSCRTSDVAVASENAKRSGLLMDSVIMTDNLATVHNSEIDRVIGVFPGMTELDAALRATLAL